MRCKRQIQRGRREAARAEGMQEEARGKNRTRGSEARQQ